MSKITLILFILGVLLTITLAADDKKEETCEGQWCHVMKQHIYGCCNEKFVCRLVNPWKFWSSEGQCTWK
ncbi:hypothetical protein KQX54_004523 [Cotesia glomerata]|uniref:Uncharacterized protein n=1 Tax=Cotesia glomerata TaxID=32391 RepID=A0AAV7I3Q9_COTGL|nr:hypothetical protein KQX54_004523 [Cotesia glomerata]